MGCNDLMLNDSLLFWITLLQKAWKVNMFTLCAASPIICAESRRLAADW